MNSHMTATEARKHFYSVVDTAKNPGVPVVITHGGIPKVVVMSYDEFEGWQETMAILSDPDPSLEADILKGIADTKTGKRPKDTVTLDELKSKLHS